jgi:hypothetical protein
MGLERNLHFDMVHMHYKTRLYYICYNLYNKRYKNQYYIVVYDS